MLPFISVGSVQIPLYGLMIIIGFLAGLLTSFVRRRKLNLKNDDMLNMILFAGIGALVGGKLLYIITMIGPVIEKWDQIIAITTNPVDIIVFIGGGLVFYGGIIGALIMVFIYLRRYKLAFFEHMDTLIVSAPLMHAFGRVGCFFGGCCYGKEAPPPYGVRFVNALDEHIRDVYFLPTQLYEMGFNLIIYGILLLVFYKTPYVKGRATGLYLSMYAVCRFILEFFRGDTIRGSVLFLSTSQWISIPMLALGLWLIFDRGVLIPFLSGKQEPSHESQPQSAPEEVNAAL